ncbi:MAG: hypothetical protein V3R76_06765 [Gammaproteobacteria bacterium]
MNTDHTEIRRLANGSIDTDYYLRHCHHERSLSAHRVIVQTFNYPWKLVQQTRLHWFNYTPLGNVKRQLPH